MNEQKILTGKGITVAVLDTGIFPHIDFDNRIVAFRDLVYGRETPYDDNGHGTHVCGILGGSGRASGGKYRGTAPECRFLVAKILDRRGNGRKQDILAAIDWVCKERIRLNIRILNISVGTTEQEKSVDDLLVQAVERAWDDGITVVTAAGNLGPAPGSITAPGSSRKVITVGAGDLLEPRRGISGCGPTRDCVCKPDLVAPGKRLISCAPGCSRKEQGGQRGPSMRHRGCPEPWLWHLNGFRILQMSRRKCCFANRRETLAFRATVRGMGCFKQTVFCLFCETLCGSIKKEK